MEHSKRGGGKLLKRVDAALLYNLTSIDEAHLTKLVCNEP